MANRSRGIGAFALLVLALLALSDTKGLQLTDSGITTSPPLQSTYLGGSIGGGVAALAIHPWTGEIHLTGRRFVVSSMDPSFKQPCGATGRLSWDLVTGTFRYFCGPGGYDVMQLFALAIHPATGDIYLGGEANWLELLGSGALPVNPKRKWVGCILQLTSEGIPVHSTFLGSSGSRVLALTVDPTSGDVFAAGNAVCGDLPAIVGGAQTDCTSFPLGGIGVGFVTRIKPDLSAFVQSTYLGLGHTSSLALAFQPANDEVYVGGSTNSPDLPGSAGGAQPTFAGGYDGFVACLRSDLRSVVHSTYLGGSADDEVEGLALHPLRKDVYVMGLTYSPDLPGTGGGAQPTLGGAYATLVACLNPELTVLRQATYWGRENEVRGYAVAIHPATGDVYIAGSTNSANLVGTESGLQPQLAGQYDGFLARFSTDLRHLLQSTYLGGSQVDLLNALAVDPGSGQIFVGGWTDSPDFPAVAGGYQPIFQGDPLGGDGVVSRITPDLRAEGSETWTPTPTSTITPAATPTWTATPTPTYTSTPAPPTPTWPPTPAHRVRRHLRPQGP